MFRNFIKLTVRQLIRQKGFTFINILGLTIGLSSCILIGLFIADELGYDNFQANGTMTTTIDGQTYTQPANGT